MISAFKERRPWAVVVITMLFGPFVGGLYLGRGKLALLYLLLEVAITIVIFFAVAELGIQYNPEIVQFGLLSLVSIPIAYQYYQIALTINLDTKPPWYSWFARWWVIIGAALLIFAGLGLFVRIYLYDIYSAASHSMAPTIMAGDQFMASKTAYGYSKFTFGIGSFIESGRVFGSMPDHGDIIVFKLPSDNKTEFVKRVVGLPGDIVQLRDGQLFLNDTATITDQVEESISIPKTGIATGDFSTYKETLPNGSNYLILDQEFEWQSDNTEKYLVPEGHIFVLGDNRDNSNDSRFPKVGFVPIDNVMGKVIWIYWRERENKLEF